MSDRGEYRSIRTVLIDGPDFQELPPNARLLLFVLKCKLGPSAIGVIPGMIAALEEHTGLDANQVHLALEVLQHAGWVRVERNVVWVVDGLKHEPSLQRTNGNHRKSVLGYLSGLPKLAIVEAFRRQYAAWLRGDEDGASDGIRMPSPMPSPIPSRSLKTETEDRRLKTSPASGDAERKATPKRRSEPKYPAYPTSVSHRLAVQWRQSRGPIDEGVFRRLTAKLYAGGSCPYAVEELEASVVAFGEAAEVAPADKSQFWSVTKWVDDVPRWVRLGAMPLVDPDTGTITERGRACTGVAA